MTMRWLALPGLLLLGPLVIAVRAEAPADVEKRLRADLQLLTSDACEGRGITTRGINLAAEHIAREFARAGLRPGGTGKGYFRTFDLTTAAKAGPNNRLALRGPLGQTITLERDRHFAVWLTSRTARLAAPLVFAGYGITSDNPKYDDYAGLDVKGKVVIVLA